MRALLVIDAQTSFALRPSWRYVSNPEIAERIAALVQVARGAGHRVYWVFHHEPGTGNVFDPAVTSIELLPPLKAQPDEPVVVKTSRNAFTTTNLQQRLTKDGINELIICGIQTEQCCETTARLGADLGYAVTFVTEATATFPIPHRNGSPERDWDEIAADPRTLSVEHIIERTEPALAGRFATIASIADLST